MELGDIPGNDTLSRLIMENENMFRIILDFLGVNSAYRAAPSLLKDRTSTDMLLLPVEQINEENPPVIIEFQQRVNRVFMKRLITYCGQVSRKFQEVDPIAVVFNIMEQRNTEELGLILENNYYTCFDCYVSKKIHIFNIDSIAAEIQNEQLSDIGALSYFFAMRERQPHNLSFRDHPVIVDLYRLAEAVAGIQDGRTQMLRESVSSMVTLFESIALRSRSNDVKTMTTRGIEHGRDALRVAGGVGNPEQTDREFIETFRQDNGEIDWEQAWSRGRAEHRYSRYMTRASLKDAYFHRRF